MVKRYVLYHKNCTDGFGAAFAAWKKFGDTGAEYIPVTHGEPLPDMDPQSEVYILDFCYPKDIVLEIQRKHLRLVILDHHITSKEAIESVKEGYFMLNKSGATIAWSYFHPNEDSDLMRYIEDRDLWRFSYPNTNLIIAALESYPRDFKIWNKLTVKELEKEGFCILKKQDQEVHTIIERAYMGNVGKYFVPIVNSSSYMSDVAIKMMETYPEAPFVGVYYVYESKGELFLKWSLRSRKGGQDVAQVATELGGGGHANASGFLEKIEINYNNRQQSK